MAATADKVLLNFQWRIESITPTHSRPNKKFRWVDPMRIDPDISSGTVRNFAVYWDGSNQDLEPTDITQRVAEHIFVLEVSYPTEYKLDLLQEIILQDRHDIIKALRTTDNFVGYNSSNTTTDIGLWGRTRLRDQIVKSTDTTWILRQEWRCEIKEAE